MTAPLVLSLFPGIGLLDMAFEAEGFCVVRGPDVLWGGDIRKFHPPAGKFDGVIGGPPCQAHSSFAHLVRQAGKRVAEDLIPEFARSVSAAHPTWFLMENVPAAPTPMVGGYGMRRLVLNNRDIANEDGIGAEQNRERAFVFGVRGMSPLALENHIDWAVLENPVWSGAILATGGRKPGTERKRGRTRGSWHGWVGGATFRHALEVQGLPPDFLADDTFTAKGKFRMVGNGVPLPMGRAIARAVKQALAERVA